ncbi:MAG: efflux RND transporter permease subunit [Leptolyngbya sp. UWPOB_LEPTO1]|uniref:efflux RND transporter permease subunit n=1 Tax=Leptolyngbya sp. UWPOB_LEPTO1 TaxID=2815653 RepID=UPI001AC22360|nr:efflux RND transporter permease subunit [Leptolyngbya sp. UWPOB_LEPTO1]
MCKCKKVTRIRHDEFRCLVQETLTKRFQEIKVIVGLASKNSILIVEFANQLRSQGRSLVQAVVEAAQERLRPILMTAIATLLGSYPLLVATGAGAASRQSLGTAVFGGMFVATFLSLFVVPILYIVVKSIQFKLMGIPRRSRESIEPS